MDAWNSAFFSLSGLTEKSSWTLHYLGSSALLVKASGQYVYSGDQTDTDVSQSPNLRKNHYLTGVYTRHAHSRYLRIVRDLPIQGRPVMLRLSARRFFCRTQDCSRRVFCEPIPQLLAKHARSTTRLIETHRTIGLALGGEPGSRLAGKLSMPASPDTLLRRVKTTRESSPPPPRIVGVDDWALRKGHTYGTIIVDLERSEVLELLPGRDGEELKRWLGDHPEVEVLSRDRWAPYADAAAVSAPQAQQVADRCHLLKNIREALERFLDRHAKQIASALTPSAPNAMDKTVNLESPTIMFPPDIENRFV